jgi:hypothetical protein
MLKYLRNRTSREKTGMAKKKSLVESIPVLILLGLLAGAVGGVGIGLVQLKAMSSTSTSAAK